MPVPPLPTCKKALEECLGLDVCILSRCWNHQVSSLLDTLCRISSRARADFLTLDTVSANFLNLFFYSWECIFSVIINNPKNKTWCLIVDYLHVTSLWLLHILATCGIDKMQALHLHFFLYKMSFTLPCCVFHVSPWIYTVPWKIKDVACSSGAHQDERF